jgi:hypothetical protein
MMNWLFDIFEWLKENVTRLILSIVEIFTKIAEVVIKGVMTLVTDYLLAPIDYFIFTPVSNLLNYIESQIALYIVPSMQMFSYHIPWIPYNTIYAAVGFYFAFQSVLIAASFFRAIMQLVQYVRRVFFSI